MNKVKFLVFSDMHMSNYWVPNPKERLSAILDRAKENNVDFVIHCGDLADNPNNSLEEIELS